MPETAQAASGMEAARAAAGCAGQSLPIHFAFPPPGPSPEPTIADPWIVSSLLQKSIRRGEIEIAQRAALTLFKVRGSAIWRRFMVIASGKGLVERLRSSGPRGIKIAEQLLDVGDGRVAEMDAGDIDVQVLSLNAPGVEQVADPAEQTAIAREANDFVLDVVKKYPKRFAAFAALPLSELGHPQRGIRILAGDRRASIASHAWVGSLN